MDMKNVLDSTIDEVLSLSALPPSLTPSIRELLTTYYSENVVMVSDHYPDVASALYGFDDNEMYSIISVAFVDSYVYVLIPTVKVAPRECMKILVNLIKDTFSESGPEMGYTIKRLGLTQSALIEILTSSTKSKRRSIDNGGEDEVVLPEMAVMRAFYECGRKAQYVSVEEAKQFLASDNSVYLCSRCHKYHQGKPPTGDTIPQANMENRWRTAWRRYHNV